MQLIMGLLDPAQVIMALQNAPELIMGRAVCIRNLMLLRTQLKAQGPEMALGPSQSGPDVFSEQNNLNKMKTQI